METTRISSKARSVASASERRIVVGLLDALRGGRGEERRRVARRLDDLLDGLRLCGVDVDGLMDEVDPVEEAA